MRVSIAVDAMGGDHGPSITVHASIRFLEETADASVILVGREADVRKVLDTVRSSALDRISVHAATEVVEMREGPASALRGKKDSSMRVASISSRREGGGLRLGGQHRRLMAISRFVLKTLPGIDRPAIASQLPTRNGSTRRSTWAPTSTARRATRPVRGDGQRAGHRSRWYRASRPWAC